MVDPTLPRYGTDLIATKSCEPVSTFVPGDINHDD